jgi:preprotein translocase subunit SecY
MNAELGRRIAFTLCALLVFRIGTYLPIPGIDHAVWQQILRGQSGGILGMADLFSGGAAGRLSIFALGIGPYVTAAIFVQLLLLVYPRTAELKRRGARGRRTVMRVTLAIAALLAASQAMGIASALEGLSGVVNAPGPLFRVIVVVALTGGTLFLVWLCGRITSRGVGNGLGLILFAGIVTQAPASIATTLEFVRQGIMSGRQMLGLGVLAIVVFGFIVVMEQARRHVRIEFAGRQVGDRAVPAGASALALKLNPAGVIPVVVASWFLSIVIILVDFAGGFGTAWVDSVTRHFGAGSAGFMIASAVATVLFAFLYTAFLLDPEDAAERLTAFGGVIPGVAPGEATAAHVDYVVSRTTVLGAVYLALVVIIPQFVIAYAEVPFYFGGVSALIVVCVALDIRTQVGAHAGVQARGDGLAIKGG